MNTFLFMYMNSRDVIICYLELRKTGSVFPIPLEFEISKFACIYNIVTEWFYDMSLYQNGNNIVKKQKILKKIDIQTEGRTEE